jgi:UDP-galactopyranose mutase
MDEFDLLIVGAGPVGCVVAERAATQLGWTCLIIDKRNHIAGNVHDCHHPSGVLIHKYGPHYFRTNDPGLLQYLSQFTEWIPGNYIVKSQVGGALVPFPINLTTLEQFFGRSLTEGDARALLERAREKIEAPRNSEEFVLSRVGRELYEAFYLGYTLKQWERHPRELEPSVCGRIPIRFNRDERYVDHRFQVTPRDGFTALFERMIRQPRIEVRLGTDFRDVRSVLKPRKATIYCGPVDEYFDHRLGRLPYRSLEFDWKVFDQPLRQPCAQINYPDTEHPYTRTVEIKHVTQQVHPQTVISYEYPRSSGEPYYPVPTSENTALYQKYAALAERETRDRKVFFSGRLARYRYINTDEAVEMALQTFQSLKELRT